MIFLLEKAYLTRTTGSKRTRAMSLRHHRSEQLQQLWRHFQRCLHHLWSQAAENRALPGEVLHRRPAMYAGTSETIISTSTRFSFRSCQGHGHVPAALDQRDPLRTISAGGDERNGEPWHNEQAPRGDLLVQQQRVAARGRRDLDARAPACHVHRLRRSFAEHPRRPRGTGLEPPEHRAEPEAAQRGQIRRGERLQGPCGDVAGVHDEPFPIVLARAYAGQLRAQPGEEDGRLAPERGGRLLLRHTRPRPGEEARVKAAQDAVAAGEEEV
uniref:Uncharacterized protein n=1 Tax=Triticum urartu TaxID=4572 RepID=A0A8R7QF27_TRIUA